MIVLEDSDDDPEVGPSSQPTQRSFSALNEPAGTTTRGSSLTRPLPESLIANTSRVSEVFYEDSDDDLYVSRSQPMLPRSDFNRSSTAPTMTATAAVATATATTAIFDGSAFNFSSSPFRSIPICDDGNDTDNDSDDCMIVQSSHVQRNTSPLKQFNFHSSPVRSPFIPLPRSSPTHEQLPKHTQLRRDSFDFLSSSPLDSFTTRKDDTDDELDIVSVTPSSKPSAPLQTRTTISGLQTQSTSTSSYLSRSKTSLTYMSTTSTSISNPSKSPAFDFLESDEELEALVKELEAGRASRTTSLNLAMTDRSQPPPAKKPRPATRATQSTSEITKIRKRLEKEQERQQKVIDRETKRLERERQRELTQANQSKRMSRGYATRELTVVCHASLTEDADLGSFIPSEVGENLAVQVKRCGMLRKHVIDRAQVISLQRRITAEFDKDEGLFKPIPERTVDEPIVIVLCKAEDYASIIKTEESLSTHVAAIKDQHPGKKVVYLVQGTESLIRKMANKVNRAMQQRVRQLMNQQQPQPSSARPRKRTQQDNSIPDDMDHVNTNFFNNSYNMLQVRYKVHVVLTQGVTDTREWIVNLLHDIGTGYYKKMRSQIHGDVDVKVKCGNNTREELANALEHIRFVTPAVSLAVSTAYGNICSLGRAVRTPRGMAELANVEKGTRGNKVGPAMANTLQRLLTSTDPDEFMNQ